MQVKSAKHYTEAGAIAGVELVVFDGARVTVRVPKDHYSADEDGRFQGSASPKIVPPEAFLPIPPAYAKVRPPSMMEKARAKWWPKPKLVEETAVAPAEATHRYTLALDEFIGKGGKIG